MIPTGALKGKCDSCGEPQCLCETCHLWKCLCEHRDLAAWPPGRAGSKALEQWEWSLCLILSLVGQQCPALCRQGLGERSCAVVSGSLRGDCLGEGWVNRVTAGSGSLSPHRDGRPSALMKSCSCYLEKSLRADHITLKIAEQWEMPSHGPDLFCAKRITGVNLVRWLLQDHGKFGWYCVKMFAFFRQGIFFQWQSKGVTLNKPLT